ncbi:MAG: zinc-binding alcohol dehydrogenase [Pseudomonadota bacterium]
MAQASDSSTGIKASALWCEDRATYAIRSERVVPATNEMAVTTTCSLISRGTERLVAEGRVPVSEMDTMRCPHQAGTFPFPVKYGYAAVGCDPAGRRVFALYPHQDRFALAADALQPVPDAVPDVRAALAANMETALTILWDSGVGPGDTVLVVGCGVVGALVARLCARVAGVRVTVCDTNLARRDVAHALGAAFATPDAAPADVDVAIHTSANPAGLATAIQAAGVEARVVEASWYGAGTQQVPLGGRFHARRLALISSQVGRIPATRAARWTHGRRLQTALTLLDDPCLDTLLTHRIAFADAPTALPALLTDPSALAIILDYQKDFSHVRP